MDLGSVVHRRLHAKDAALLVVDLYGVAPDAVFDADALGTILEVADDLALEGTVSTSTEEAHDVAIRSARDGVMHECRVDGRQRSGVGKHQVLSPLGLVCAPVVVRVLTPITHSSLLRVDLLEGCRGVGGEFGIGILHELDQEGQRLGHGERAERVDRREAHDSGLVLAGLLQ